MILDREDSLLFTVTEPDTVSIQKLQDMGCHLVLETPVNINLLLAKIKTSRQKDEDKSTV